MYFERILSRNAQIQGPQRLTVSLYLIFAAFLVHTHANFSHLRTKARPFAHFLYRLHLTYSDLQLVA